MPLIDRAVVVLPAPFAPSRARTSPSATVKRDIVQGAERAVAGGDALDLEQRRAGDGAARSGAW